MGQSAEELRQDIERTRENLGDNLDAIGDRVSPSRMVERRRNRIRASVVSVRERVMGVPRTTAGSIADRTPSMSGVTDRTGSAGAGLRSAPESARQQAQGNPLLAGAVAFGAGFAAAAVFKGSPTEAQAARSLTEAAQPLKEEATTIAKEVASGMQQSGQEAAQQLKEAASQSTEKVKEAASSSAEETKQAAASAKDEVTSTTPSS
jgi:gas vesicle protein